MVSGFMAAQAGSVQSQMAATMLKSNLDAQKSAVLTILGVGQPSLANVGVGGNLNVTA